MILTRSRPRVQSKLYPRGAAGEGAMLVAGLRELGQATLATSVEFTLN